MKRLIIADSHVGQKRDDSRGMASLVERAEADGVGEIIYLGDAFQYLGEEGGKRPPRFSSQALGEEGGRTKKGK